MTDDQIALPFGDEITPLVLHETMPLPHAEHNAAIDLAIGHIRATVLKNGTNEQQAMLRALIEALAAELGGLKR